MRVAIVGSGNIGGTLARLLAAAGHEVALAHSGGPDSLRDQVAALGPAARAATVEDAAGFGDVVVLAFPWRERGTVPGARLAGKIVVDAMNPYAPDHSLYDLEDSTSSEEVAHALPGVRLVKAFNTLFARDLASRGQPGHPMEERTALFLAGDDAAAKAIVAGLVDQIGFAPIDAGGLREGGRLLQPGSPVYTRPMRGADARAALARTRGGLDPSPDRSPSPTA
jgi:predicted dinucleotide-binding enzyme